MDKSLDFIEQVEKLTKPQILKLLQLSMSEAGLKQMVRHYYQGTPVDDTVVDMIDVTKELVPDKLEDKHL